MTSTTASDIFQGSNRQIVAGGRSGIRRTNLFGRVAAQAAKMPEDTVPGQPNARDIDLIREHLLDAGEFSPFNQDVDQTPFGDGYVSIKRDGTSMVYGEDEKLLWCAGPDRLPVTTDVGRARSFDLYTFVQTGLTWQPDDAPDPTLGRNGPTPG